MDRTEALESLTPSYAAALRLRDEGLSLTEIAVRLDLDPATMSSMLHLAEAKLERLLNQPGKGV